MRYEDLVRGGSGQYRVRLMDNRNPWDCCYPGVDVLAAAMNDASSEDADFMLLSGTSVAAPVAAWTTSGSSRESGEAGSEPSTTTTDSKRG